MKTINVGVVGVGAMGENHVRVYHKMEEANLLAVSDVSERALKKIEKKYGAKGFTEYSELLENPEIEAVSVCVPTTFHHSVVMEAIKHKKHVLVEKPIAFTLNEAEEMIAAAKAAHAHSFIKRLPHGYDTQIAEDGGNLSQGQKQLLCIARVMLCLPPMLFLDEATSSIDTRTEALVQKGMDALMHGRTTFVIAHRLSTVMNSDCIMVLDHGHIIERGSHEDLIAQKGTYYQLYTGAFELE